MRYLFIHQNMPGQFVHLTRALARQPGAQVVFLTERKDRRIDGVTTLSYAPPREVAANGHPYLRQLEAAVLRGQQVVRALGFLLAQGFKPDIVIGHPGWGELLFVKEVLPDAPLLSFCEFYFPLQGVALEAAPEPASVDLMATRRMENAHLLLSLQAADRGWSPTPWQRASFPIELRPKIEVIFEGVDVDEVVPSKFARFQLPSGRILARGDEVITFTARGLEPHRGFPQFLRSLPALLRERPDAQVVIAGEERAAYGPPPNAAQTWREVLTEEISLDSKRVHFVGWLPRSRYISLLQTSRLHVHLTAPFVLSWSMFEAMAAGCLVLASDTPPVKDVLIAGENGLLAPMYDVERLTSAMVEALENPNGDALRRAARDTAVREYSLAKCLPAQLKLLARMTAQSGERAAG